MDDWELAMDMARLALAQDAKQTESEETGSNRVCYIIYSEFKWRPVAQHRASCGEWVVDNEIQWSTFYTCDVPGMTDIDRFIAKNVYVSKTSELVAHLIDSTRVFCYDDTKHAILPVKIEEVSAKLRFSYSRCSINIESNVDCSRYDIPSINTICLNSTNYQVVKLSTVQQSILHSLLSCTEYPLNSLEQMQTMAEQLTAHFEISSNLNQCAQLPVTNGSGRLLVNITPGGVNKYEACLRAKPFENSDDTFSVGGEPEIYIGQIQGQEVRIYRDLDAERANLQEISAMIGSENRSKKRLPDQAEMYLLNSRSLLNLLEYAHNRADSYELQWPEGKEIKFKGVFDPSKIQLTIKSNEKWFRVEGDIDLCGTKTSIQKLAKIADSAGEQGYVRIDDSTYIKMTETLRKQLAGLNAITSTNGSIPQYHVGTLAKIIGQSDRLKADADLNYQRQLQKMQDAYASTPVLPDNLNATLRDYQREGYQWLMRLDAWNAGACLADDMGLGKTVQAIAFLLKKAGNGVSLVVAPKSVTPNWMEEIRRFAPTLHPILLTTESDKAACIQETKSGDVVIASYGLLTTNEAAFSAKQWNVACLDEAHQIKNRMTRMSQVAMQIQASSRLLLTGTPVQNHLGELWNLFQFINPGLLGPYEQFSDRYLSKETSKEALERLHDMVHPFILRRTKGQVLTQLPAKLEYDYLVKMQDEEMAAYEQMRQVAANGFRSMMQGSAKINFFESLTRLRLAACDMALVKDQWAAESSKMHELERLLRAIANIDNSILIFSQFTSFLEKVKKLLARLNLTYCYLDGQTPLAGRQQQIREFQSGAKRLFLISLRAGGIGLNLTRANYVIHLDPWWNPAIEDQATDRAHRIGQQHDVTVIHLIAEHTVEQKMLRLHLLKQKISDDVLTGTSQSYKLSYEDIMEMVSPFR